ncbi:MAG: CaiB/BaiF CoA-transferase family protein, partial [Planctomycetota bacterium]
QGIVYAGISGYGAEGEWAHLPGQDLLAQARSGIMWLTGNQDHAPTPTGLAMADIYAGMTVVQGVLAALLGRASTGRGRQIETSLLEGLVDVQFEQLTDYLNTGRQMARRSEIGNANAYAPAPYGVFATKDGYLVIAMTALDRLADLLETTVIQGLASDPRGPTRNRDAIMRILAERIAKEATAHWLAILEPAGVWCAEVLDWPALLDSTQGEVLDMLQSVKAADGAVIETTRLPMRIDGQRPTCELAGPSLDAHGHSIRAELGLESKAAE